MKKCWRYFRIFVVSFIIAYVVFLLALFAGIAQAEHQMTKLDLAVKVKQGTGLNPGDSLLTVAMRCGVDFIQSAAIYPVCIGYDTIALTANAELAALPATCYKPIMVWAYPTGYTLDWTNAWDKQKVPDATSISTERLDKVWTIQDDNIKYLGFDPVPTVADSVKIFYEATVPEIAFGADSNAQRVYVRECYHPALVAAVKHYLYERYERFDKSALYMKKVETFINAAERKLSVPPIDLLMSPRTYTRP